MLLNVMPGVSACRSGTLAYVVLNLHEEFGECHSLCRTLKQLWAIYFVRRGVAGSR